MQALSDAERIVIQGRLTQAESAYHAIITGKAVKRFIDQNGEQVEYSTTNIANLQSYIRYLRGLLDACYARYTRPRPIGFLF